MAIDERRESGRTATSQKESTTHKETTQKESKNVPSRQETGRSLAWHDPMWFWSADPFGSMRRVMEQMDRWFADVGPRSAGRRASQLSAWTPQIETFQRGDQFVIRTDLPGLRKEDVNVELNDDAITIQGERREEHEDKREGFYRSERSYGSFYRVVPLPEGAISETAKASFNNGVLEIVVQAPPREVSRGRRIEISQAPESGRSS